MIICNEDEFGPKVFGEDFEKHRVIAREKQKRRAYTKDDKH